MQNEIDIPEIDTSTISAERIESSHRYLTESTARANEASAEYRKNISTINDRIIVLSGGTVTLLLTFLGVLVGRETLPRVSYELLFLSCGYFILVMALLLLSRWFQSLYVFKINHLYMMRSLKEENALKLSVVQRSDQGLLDTNTGRVMTPDALDELAKKFRLASDRIATVTKNDKYIADLSQRLSRYLPLLSYIIFAGAYIATLLFFTEIVRTL